MLPVQFAILYKTCEPKALDYVQLPYLKRVGIITFMRINYNWITGIERQLPG